MTERRHAITDPIDEGMLDVGDGHSIHWEVAGDPDGKPTVLLHGGPGSGSSPRMRQMFDPSRYLIVQFDQRGCGRSTPSASRPEMDLSANTTQALVSDIERLRVHLGIDRWLVWGGSWGTTLGLAYAEAHPDSVTELMLASVVTTSSDEVLWITRAMGRIFPERWRTFVEALPPYDRDGNLARAYNRLLMDCDPAVHEPAALAWCDWEDAHVSLAGDSLPSLQYEDPAFRLTFARLVTHYWANAGFLEDGQIMRDVGHISHIPTFLTHGRRDVSGPVDIAYALARGIPGAELFISETEGHGGPQMVDWMIGILDHLASDQAASSTP